MALEAEIGLQAYEESDVKDPTTPVTALPPLSFSEYAKRARQSDRFKGEPKAISRLSFGFYGEVGGLLASIKKVDRDTLQETETQFASEELGDALWYLVALSQERNVDADELGIESLNVLRKRLGEASKNQGAGVAFRHLDGLLATQHPTQSTRDALLGELAYSAGTLARGDLQQMHLADPPTVAKQLGIVLAELAVVTASFGLSLEGVARANLEKISSRWPGEEKVWTPLFDEDRRLPSYERFPRKFSVTFEERDSDDHPHVVQSIDGVFVGDRLTDNSESPDGYRFHDVFHLAYVAYLGWSPVIRGLLKRKRKSQPSKDENQDGARAMIIEEGIATWIFNHATQRNLYEDVQVGKLEYGLLKQIRSMVSGYEVEACPLWQWELAILKGFEAFRRLYAERSGIVNVDMEAHSMRFETLKVPTP